MLGGVNGIDSDEVAAFRARLDSFMRLAATVGRCSPVARPKVISSEWLRVSSAWSSDEEMEVFSICRFIVNAARNILDILANEYDVSSLYDVVVFHVLPKVFCTLKLDLACFIYSCSASTLL